VIGVLNSLNEVDKLLQAGNALQTLYDLIPGESSVENVSKLEDIVGLLEIHEAEVRRLRQSLSLRLRQHALETYLESLRRRGP